MEMIQNIAVFVIAALAAVYLMTKFIWTPAFLKKKSASKSACGNDGCGCH